MQKRLCYKIVHKFLLKHKICFYAPYSLLVTVNLNCPTLFRKDAYFSICLCVSLVCAIPRLKAMRTWEDALGTYIRNMNMNKSCHKPTVTIKKDI